MSYRYFKHHARPARATCTAVAMTFAIPLAMTMGGLYSSASLAEGAHVERAHSHQGERGKAGTDVSEQGPALVLFLTRTEPMVAGHALHVGMNMLAEGVQVTVILVGDAGRFGLRGLPAGTSAVSKSDLGADLERLIAAGGQVLITPYTLAHFNAEPSQLRAGITLPREAKRLHARMFEPGAQVVVW